MKNVSVIMIYGHFKEKEIQTAIMSDYSLDGSHTSARVNSVTESCKEIPFHMC